MAPPHDVARTRRHRAASLMAVALAVLMAPSVLAGGAHAGAQALRSPGRIVQDRVHFDWPGDGHLWVRGRDYKARFGVDGVEFVPFLGSHAPYNFPVRFRVKSASRGGVTLELEDDVAPVRETETGAERVCYDRGGLVEYYVVGLDSIEQCFRIDEPCAEAGDLVVRIAVETELGWSDGAQGFSFSNDLGGVRYGRAVAFDRLGARSPSPARWVGEELEIRVPADFLERAEYPLTVDPVISPFSIGGPVASSHAADAAYDATHDLYMLTWAFPFSSTDNDVYTQAYDPSGNPIPGGDAWIDATTDNWTEPRIANCNGADQFMVAAIEDPDANLWGTVSGRTRSATLNGMGVQRQLSQDNALGRGVEVGGDPGDDPAGSFCAVWMHHYSGLVASRTFDSSGVALQGFTRWLNYPFQSGNNPSISKHAASTSWGLSYWIVVWEEVVGNDTDILGALVDEDNGVIGLTYFPVDESTEAAHLPSVSGALDGPPGFQPYLVTYTTNDQDVHGRVFEGSTPLTPPLDLNALEGGGHQAHLQLEASASTDGSTFLVTYTETQAGNVDVFLAEFDYAGGALVCTSPHQTLAATGAGEFGARVCSQRSGGGPSQEFLATWVKLDSSGNRIEGATLESLGFGHTYCDSYVNSAGSVAHLRAVGSRSVSAADMTLVAEGCPPNVPGLLFLGTAQIDLPFGEGRRCVGGATKRMHPFTITNSQGVGTFDLDFSAGYASDFSLGSLTVNYQYWFRDLAGGGAQFNLTDALHVEHTP